MGKRIYFYEDSLRTQSYSYDEVWYIERRYQLVVEGSIRTKKWGKRWEEMESLYLMPEDWHRLPDKIQEALKKKAGEISAANAEREHKLATQRCKDTACINGYYKRL